MKLKEIKEILHAKLLTEDVELDEEINSVIAADLMSDVLNTISPADLLITGLAHNQTIRTCEIAGIKAIIFVRNKNPKSETIELAKASNIPLFSCKLSMFEVCGILYSRGIRNSIC